MTDTTEKKAADLVADLRDATSEDAQAILHAELERPEADQRKTVLEAAQDRLAELEPLADVEGSTLHDAAPTGAWAQLLDGDGNPVTVDGKIVETDQVP